MIHKIILSLLSFCSISAIAQEKEQNIKEAGLTYINQQFDENSTVEEYSLHMVTKGDLSFKVISRNINHSTHNIGVEIKKVIVKKNSNYSPFIIIGEGEIIPIIWSGVHAQRKINQKTSLLTGGSIVSLLDNTNLATIDFGVLRKLEGVTVLTRIYNSSAEQNLFNPSGSLSFLKEKEKSILQFTLEGGRQNFIGNGDGITIINRIGTGIWYQQQLGKYFKISITGNLSSNMKQGEFDRLIFSNQSTIIYKF